MIKIEFMICSDQHQLRAEKEAAKARTKLIQQLEDRLNFHIDIVTVANWYDIYVEMVHIKFLGPPF